MIDPIQILWTPAGQNLPALGARALVDVTDGDTPNIRMPVRMLSIDTPEVTAGSAEQATQIDADFQELAGWIREGRAPVSRRFADHVLPRLETGRAGTLQFEQGTAASEFYKALIERRLSRDNGTRRKLFVRGADEPFDRFGRLLAYVAPSYSRREREAMTRRERSTFNLDLVESGWASSFILFPSIPGELDLPLLIDAAVNARDEGRGVYADPLAMPAYEYRAMEKLHRVTRRIVEGENVPARDRFGWRSRYCLDIRTRLLYGPEDYPSIDAPYRLWIWPEDVQRAVGMLNLTPAPVLTASA